MSARRQFGSIRKLPSGRWQARYPAPNGSLIAAPTTFAARTDAARYLGRVQADLERGHWQDHRLGRITFAEWMERWLASNPSKRSTTLARDTTVLRTHALPLLGSRPMSSITPLDIKGVVDEMASKLAPDTVRTNLAVIRAVFNAAVEAEILSRSPVRTIRVAKAESRDRPTLTMEEILRLADAIGARYRALVLVGAILGLRWSEAIGLRVRDIDFLRRTLTVRQTLSEVEGRLAVAATKSRRSRRTMSVPQFVIDELAQHVACFGRSGDDLVFVGPKCGALRRSFAARTFVPAVSVAAIDARVTFHGLRHIAASLMVEAGVHPRVIQQRLGHATARLSMELYAHVPEAADRGVAESLDRCFRESGSATEERLRDVRASGAAGR
jgi:integrase